MNNCTKFYGSPSKDEKMKTRREDILSILKNGNLLVVIEETPLVFVLWGP